MILLIEGQKTPYIECTTNRKLNAVASEFSAKINEGGIELLEKTVEIYTDDNVLVLKGEVVSVVPDGLSATPGNVSISGWSKAGIIENVHPSEDDYPLQKRNLNLEDIHLELLRKYEIGIARFGSDYGRSFKPFPVIKIDPNETIMDILTKLAMQRGLFMSHVADGDILYIADVLAQSKKVDISKQIKSFKPDYNIADIHSPITVRLQATAENDGIQRTYTNPFVKKHRPFTYNMQDGDGESIDLFAKKLISAEMLNISATVETEHYLEIMTRFEADGNEWIVTETETSSNKDLDVYSAKCCLSSVYDQF